MLCKEDVNALARDFRRWGKVAAGRIMRLGKKYGVLCSSTRYSTGKKG